MVRELYLDKSGKVGREGEERIEGGGRKEGKERVSAKRAPRFKILSLFRDTADILIFKTSPSRLGFRAEGRFLTKIFSNLNMS